MMTLLINTLELVFKRRVTPLFILLSMIQELSNSKFLRYYKQ